MQWRGKLQFYLLCGGGTPYFMPFYSLRESESRFFVKKYMAANCIEATLYERFEVSESCVSEKCTISTILQSGALIQGKEKIIPMAMIFHAFATVFVLFIPIGLDLILAGVLFLYIQRDHQLDQVNAYIYVFICAYMIFYNVDDPKI